MGITRGVMRVGAYGGQTRRTYGALGDEVNLARLYEAAILAFRLGATREIVAAMAVWGIFFLLEGQLERGLALIGLAISQQAWNPDFQSELDALFLHLALDPAVVEAGLAKGEELDWDAMIQELLRETKPV